MAERLPQPSSALAAPAGRYGRATGPAGVTVMEVTGFGLASVSVRRNSREGLAGAVHTCFGLDLPATPRRVDGSQLSLLWCGPEQWLALRASTPPEGMEAWLHAAIGAHATIADQSHSRVLLRISGAHVRDALAKGCAVDLHDRVFRPGDTALTQIAHIGVQICQLDASPIYEIAAPRSFADSLWRWLEASAAEFGLELAPGP